MVETLISWGATHCFGVVGDGINSIIEALRKSINISGWLSRARIAAAGAGGRIEAPPPQPITRPKDLVMRFIEKGVTSGGDPGPSNRITLLRYDAAGGKPPTRSVFSTIFIRRSAWS